MSGLERALAEALMTTDTVPMPAGWPGYEAWAARVHASPAYREAFTREAAEALSFVAHDRRLCKSSDYWHAIAHADDNGDEEKAIRADLAAALVARLLPGGGE